MKRITYLYLLATAILVLGMTAVAQEQSDNLAQYARRQKQQKASAEPAGKVFDNDNLPKTEHISVVGNESASTSDSAKDGQSTDANKSTSSPESTPDQSKAGNEEKPAAIQPGQSTTDRQQAVEDWQARIKQQREALGLAQRELDVLQREYRLRTATVASDVGYRLRNAAQWDKEDKQYKEQIAGKQKIVDEAQQKLTHLEEDARKAGIPTKARE